MTFIEEIAQVINKYSQENGSNTPDYMLANYLEACLRAFEKTVQNREEWYGRSPKPATPEIERQLNKMKEDRGDIPAHSLEAQLKPRPDSHYGCNDCCAVPVRRTLETSAEQGCDATPRRQDFIDERHIHQDADRAWKTTSPSDFSGSKIAQQMAREDAERILEEVEHASENLSGVPYSDL